MPENNLNDKRVMIVSGSGLGDLIVLTPALRRLKEKFPACKLIFLCRDYHRDIPDNLSYIDKVVCMYRGRFLGRYRALPLIFGLDAVVFTDYQPAILFMATLFRVPIRAGHKRDESKMTKLLTKNLQASVFESPDYVAETQAKVISEALDINLDGDMTNLDVPKSNDDDIRAVDIMLEDIGLRKDSPYILLSPFTGLEQRNLPANTAEEFIHSAEERYKMPVVISAPPHKHSEALKLSRYALTKKTSIKELIELVRRAKLLVTPDSGPMHVAGAVKTKCVALFSKDLPSRWAPKHNCIPLYLNLPCSPCSHDTARACPHVKCMLDFKAEMILDACDKFLLGE